MEGSVTINAQIRNAHQVAQELAGIGDEAGVTAKDVLAASKIMAAGHKEAEAAAKAQAAANRAMAEASKSSASTARAQAEAARATAAQTRAATEAARAATAQARMQAEAHRTVVAEIRRQEAETRALNRAQKEAEISAQAQGNMLKGLMMRLGALGAAYLSVQAIMGAGMKGVGYNSQLEGLSLGITSIVAANEQIIDAQGNQLEGIAKIHAAQGQVAEVFAQLKKDAVDTTATLPQLANAFNAAVGPALAMGMTLDETRKITVAMVQTMGAMQIPLDQARQEVTSILQGTISQDSMMAKQLNLSSQQIESWKQQGVLAEKLLEKMRDFTAAGELAGQTWEGLTSTLDENISSVLGKGTEPITDVLKDAMREFNQAFDGETGDSLKNVAYQFGGIIADGLGQAKLIAADLGRILLFGANNFARVIQEGRMNAAINDNKPFQEAMRKRLGALDNSQGPGIGDAREFVGFRQAAMRGANAGSLMQLAETMWPTEGGPPKMQSRNRDIRSQIIALIRSASAEAAGVRLENVSKIADDPLGDMAKGGHKYVPNKKAGPGNEVKPEKIAADRKKLADELGIISKDGLDKELEQERQWYEGKKKLAHGHKELLKKLADEHMKREDGIRAKYAPAGATGLGAPISDPLSGLGLNVAGLGASMAGLNSKFGLGAAVSRAKAPAASSGGNLTSVGDAEWYAPMVSGLTQLTEKGITDAFAFVAANDFGGFGKSLLGMMAKSGDALGKSIASFGVPLLDLAVSFGNLIISSMREAEERTKRVNKHVRDIGLTGDLSKEDKRALEVEDDAIRNDLLKDIEALHGSKFGTSDTALKKAIDQEIEARQKEVDAIDAARKAAWEQADALEAMNQRFADFDSKVKQAMDDGARIKAGVGGVQDAFKNYMVGSGQMTNADFLEKELKKSGFMITDQSGAVFNSGNFTVDQLAGVNVDQLDPSSPNYRSASEQLGVPEWARGQLTEEKLLEAIKLALQIKADKDKAMPGSTPQNPLYTSVINFKDMFAFAPTGSFFRASGPNTSRADSLQSRAVNLNGR